MKAPLSLAMKGQPAALSTEAVAIAAGCFALLLYIVVSVVTFSNGDTPITFETLAHAAWRMLIIGLSGA